MTDLRISDIARMTGFSMRYWQRRATVGDIPGTRMIRLGERHTFLVDEKTFDGWWRAQQVEVKPCPRTPRTSAGAGASGGTGSSRTAKPSKARYKRETLESLKSDLKVGAEN